MFRRSFVSVYFGNQILQVLQLSASGKVKKSISLDIPREIIKDSKVLDPDGLSLLLLNLWRKFSIKERAVGIIIPERLTFIKSFNTPKLSPSELDEAVKWQVQEYFPEMANLTFDWKIVGRGDQGLEILLVLVEEKILSNYIKAFEKANLLPLAVEIPSVSLSTLLPDAYGSLVIYSFFSESILVLAKGVKIFGTSVVSADNTNEILQTADKMLFHFKNLKVERLFVAGAVSLDESLLESFVRKHNLEVRTFVPKIKGVSEENVQEFLIPISMQLRDIFEPASPFSINLLPKSLSEKYKKIRMKLQVWSLMLTISIFVWLSFLLSLGSYVFLSQEIQRISSGLTSGSKVQENKKEALENISFTNEMSKKIINIKKISVSPQKIMNLIFKNKPQDVQVQKYDFDFDKGIISVSGISPTSKLLVEFKQNLENEPDFANVSIPISSFEKESNLEFSISLEYEPLTTKIKKASPGTKSIPTDTQRIGI